MITEKDLKIEYHRDTGCDADGVDSGFDDWILEEYLKLRNLLLTISEEWRKS